VESFKHYLVQDYLFLVRVFLESTLRKLTFQVQFARAHALAAYKTKSIDDIATVSFQRHDWVTTH
jgi:thiaminase